MNTKPSSSLNASRETVAPTSSGYLMLLALLAVLVLAIIFAFSQARIGILIATFGGIVFFLIAKGFYVLQPNQAAAIILFGSYKGTDRATSLRWVCRGWARVNCWPVPTT